MEIILATNNKGKVREMKEIMEGTGIEVFSLKDKGVEIEVEEDGTTFEENALKKAKEVAEATGMIAVSDDSGLEVYALNMRPGIYSARYAGENATSQERNMKLLDEMKDVPDDKRGARFVSAVAIVFPNGKSEIFRGEVEGTILREEKGEGGFGYDPLFFYEPFNKTLAEVSLDEKDKVSHRGVAVKKLKEYLLSL